MAGKTREKKPGPDADRVAIEGDWREAVKKAVGIEKPPAGWPKPGKGSAGGRKKPTTPRK